METTFIPYLEKWPDSVIKRGHIYFANLNNMGLVGNHIQTGIRPVLVISNESNNKFSPLVNVLPLTSSPAKVHKYYPMHAIIDVKDRTNAVLCEMVMTIPKDLIGNHYAVITDAEMEQVESCLKLQLGILENQPRRENGEISPQELYQREHAKWRANPPRML